MSIVKVFCAVFSPPCERIAYPPDIIDGYIPTMQFTIMSIPELDAEMIDSYFNKHIQDEFSEFLERNLDSGNKKYAIKEISKLFEKHCKNNSRWETAGS